MKIMLELPNVSRLEFIQASEALLAEYATGTLIEFMEDHATNFIRKMSQKYIADRVIEKIENL